MKKISLRDVIEFFAIKTILSFYIFFIASLAHYAELNSYDFAIRNLWFFIIDLMILFVLCIIMKLKNAD